MAQFDLREVAPGMTGAARYLLELQADPVDELGLCIVVPVKTADQVSSFVRRIHIPFNYGDERLVICMAELVSLPERMLGPVRGNAAQLRSSITEAIDFVFAGF